MSNSNETKSGKNCNVSDVVNKLENTHFNKKVEETEKIYQINGKKYDNLK